MSYIIDCTDFFASTKLTQTGRELLSKGQLNFSFWAAGDSEINYNREEIVENTPALSATSEIFRPKDRQPELKSFLTSGGTDYFNQITPATIKSVKVVVNNRATERGFFSGTTPTFTTLTSSRYIVATGVISTDKLTGGTTLEIGSSAIALLTVGDIILFKFTTPTLGSLGLNTNSEATPHLFYKIQTSASTTEIGVDRNLPNLSAATSADTQYIIYQQGEVKDAFGSGSTTSYWDTGTLAFDSSCDVSIEDVPVWNMNNVYAETLAGITGATLPSGYGGHEYFGSYTYLGSMNPYFGFDLSGTGISSSAVSSICQGLSGLDNGQKVLSILHYTNNTISNFYGEFFHIDIANSKRLTLNMPDIMYHRRDTHGGIGSSGITMGMEFTTSGVSQYVGTTNIEFYDLIESPSFVTGSTTITVGRVYPQLKVITLHDEELVAAMSYKANRNWTLPALALNLQAPNSGSGLLEQNKVMYVTYQLAMTGGTGITTSLPCQKYAKILNSTNSSRDIQFRVENLNLLPYMRKTEAGDYDGRGFYANTFKVLYQIVDEEDTRPNPDNWLEVDFTTTGMTSGGTISPASLENQNPTINGFLLSTGTTSGAVRFTMISDLNLPLKTETDKLQFGDERFFYGNINTWIGATIYKTIFDIRLNSSYFKATTNSTRSTDILTNPPSLRVSEIGIYDNNKNLVMISKLSEPIPLVVGQTIMIELSMDF